MKKPTMRITESDAIDVIASIDGYIGSWNLHETIGTPIAMKNFDKLSLDEIKENMRKSMQRLLDGSDMMPHLISESNAYYLDGRVANDLPLDFSKLKEGTELSMSEKGIGFVGAFDVKMDDGTIKTMDLIVAPWIRTDSNDLCESMDRAAMGQSEPVGKYFLEKYGDESLKKAGDANYALNAYENVPDHVKNLIDALHQDPMGLDWDDLTPHESSMQHHAEKTADQKRIEAIKAHRDQKKEKTGLSNPVIAYSMGGAVKSPYVPEAGIRVLQYDSSLPIDVILRNERDNLTVAIGDVIGSEETGKEKFLVGKPVTDGRKTYLPMIYSGFTSENEGEVDEAVRYLVEHTVKDAKLPDGTFVGRNGWELEDTIYRPTESQLQNAVERYTPSTGIWMGKNIDKPITLDTSLVREMENDGLQNEGNDGLG